MMQGVLSQGLWDIIRDFAFENSAIGLQEMDGTC